MIKATYENKQLVLDILTSSFNANKSVNYIVKQDSKREQRIKALMDYSFEVCYLFGDIYLSEDNNACALVLYPDQKKTTFKFILLDIKLMFSCIGIENIVKALNCLRLSTLSKNIRSILRHFLKGSYCQLIPTKN